MQPPTWVGPRPNKGFLPLILVGGVLMILGSALGGTFGLLYAFTFPGGALASPLFTLASIVSLVGRIMYAAGICLAFFGVLQACRATGARLGWGAGVSTAASTGDPLLGASPAQPVASTSLAMVGVVVVVVGQILGLLSQSLIFFLQNVLGFQLQFVVSAVAGVMTSVGFLLVFYGVGLFLSRLGR